MLCYAMQAAVYVYLARGAPPLDLPPMPPPRAWDRVVAGATAFEDAHLTKLVWLLKDEEEARSTLPAMRCPPPPSDILFHPWQARGGGPLGRQVANMAVLHFEGGGHWT
jgi:hypothetical protein